MQQAQLNRWNTYFANRNSGNSVPVAAKMARIALNSAYRFENAEPGNAGAEAASLLGVTTVGGNLVAPPLSKEAAKALEDFAYFRLRYFGRTSLPWAERAAYEVLTAIHSDDREYLIINVAPGSGKSTLFTNDIPCWLIAKDRSIRIMVGSRTERQARMYVGRIKRNLERASPLRADADSLDAGIAFDAKAALAEDYGAFKPEARTDLWRQEGLVVQSLNGQSADDKEPTVSAWGMDSGFLGGRFDFVIWDDLVDRRNSRHAEAREQLADWYVGEAETRLEPGGAMVLQGQRIVGTDLYRNRLDAVDLDGHKKYRHIVYPAHDEQRCQHKHEPRDPAWPEGCLLDPHRLPYRFLAQIAADTPRTFAISYQQQDGDGAGGLAEYAWLLGGLDSEGNNAPGCLDRERMRNEIPEHLRDSFKAWSFLTVDPSPAEWWGIFWWVIDLESENRYVIDIIRRKMSAQQFIDMNIDTQEFSGLVPELHKKSLELGAPIRHIVVEVNAAQKWLIQQPHVQRWMAATGVHVVPHTTGVNKSDPKFGVESLGSDFKQGKIRLPYADPYARMAVSHLINEATAWPDGDTDDLVMSAWFMKLTLANMSPPTVRGRYTQPRPAWLKGTERGLAYAR